MVGEEFDAAAQARGVRAVAHQSQLQLFIGVAAVVAPVAQPRRRGHHQAGVAVLVEIRRHDVLDRSGFVQTQRRSDLFKAPLADIAPDPDPAAKGQEVQPAVIVIIQQQKPAGLQAVERDRDALAAAAV